MAATSAAAKPSAAASGQLRSKPAAGTTSGVRPAPTPAPGSDVASTTATRRSRSGSLSAANATIDTKTAVAAGGRNSVHRRSTLTRAPTPNEERWFHAAYTASASNPNPPLRFSASSDFASASTPDTHAWLLHAILRRLHMFPPLPTLTPATPTSPSLTAGTIRSTPSPTTVGSGGAGGGGGGGGGVASPSSPSSPVETGTPVSTNGLMSVNLTGSGSGKGHRSTNSNSTIGVVSRAGTSTNVATASASPDGSPTPGSLSSTDDSLFTPASSLAHPAAPGGTTVPVPPTAVATISPSPTATAPVYVGPTDFSLSSIMAVSPGAPASTPTQPSSGAAPPPATTAAAATGTAARGETRRRSQAIFDVKTIIAHLRASESEDDPTNNLQKPTPPAADADSDDASATTTTTRRRMTLDDSSAAATAPFTRVDSIAPPPAGGQPQALPPMPESPADSSLSPLAMANRESTDSSSAIDALRSAPFTGAAKRTGGDRSTRGVPKYSTKTAPSGLLQQHAAALQATATADRKSPPPSASTVSNGGAVYAEKLKLLTLLENWINEFPAHFNFQHAGSGKATPIAAAAAPSGNGVVVGDRLRTAVISTLRTYPPLKVRQAAVSGGYFTDSELKAIRDLCERIVAPLPAVLAAIPLAATSVTAAGATSPLPETRPASLTIAALLRSDEYVPLLSLIDRFADSSSSSSASSTAAGATSGIEFRNCFLLTLPYFTTGEIVLQRLLYLLLLPPPHIAAAIAEEEQNAQQFASNSSFGEDVFTTPSSTVPSSNASISVTSTHTVVSAVSGGGTRMRSSSSVMDSNDLSASTSDMIIFGTTGSGGFGGAEGGDVAQSIASADAASALKWKNDRLRLCSCLQHWSVHYPEDFDPAMATSLTNTLQSFPPASWWGNNAPGAGAGGGGLIGGGGLLLQTRHERMRQHRLNARQRLQVQTFEQDASKLATVAQVVLTQFTKARAKFEAAKLSSIRRATRVRREASGESVDPDGKESDSKATVAAASNVTPSITALIVTPKPTAPAAPPPATKTGTAQLRATTPVSTRNFHQHVASLSREGGKAKKFFITGGNPQKQSEYQDDMCLELLKHNPRFIAEQLTLLGVQRVLDLGGPRGLMNKSTVSTSGVSSGGTLSLSSPNQMLLSNQMSTWIASSILLCREASTRQRLTKLWIQIGGECLVLRNFSSVFEIVYGLNHNSVYRLRTVGGTLFESCGSSTFALYERLNQFVSPNRNYVQYRTAVNESRAHASLPYFGVLFRDVVLTTEHKPIAIKRKVPTANLPFSTPVATAPAIAAPVPAPATAATTAITTPPATATIAPPSVGSSVPPPASSSIAVPIPGRKQLHASRRDADREKSPAPATGSDDADSDAANGVMSPGAYTPLVASFVHDVKTSSGIHGYARRQPSKHAASATIVMSLADSVPEQLLTTSTTPPTPPTATTPPAATAATTDHPSADLKSPPVAGATASTASTAPISPTSAAAAAVVPLASSIWVNFDKCQTIARMITDNLACTAHFPSAMTAAAAATAHSGSAIASATDSALSVVPGGAAAHASGGAGPSASTAAASADVVVPVVVEQSIHSEYERIVPDRRFQLFIFTAIMGALTERELDARSLVIQPRGHKPRLV